MWITQKEKDIMIFRDFALVFPECVTWHMIKICLFVSNYWKHWCRFYLRPHKISFLPPTSLPACHSILWFTAVILLSPFVCSPAVVYESCPCLLSTSCTFLITSAPLSLCGKPSMLALMVFHENLLWHRLNFPLFLAHNLQLCSRERALLWKEYRAWFKLHPHKKEKWRLVYFLLPWIPSLSLVSWYRWLPFVELSISLPVLKQLLFMPVPAYHPLYSFRQEQLQNILNSLR